MQVISRKAVTSLRRVSFVAVLLMTVAVVGQPEMPPVGATPDHVCLPSVSEEDAAWGRLKQEWSAALHEFDAVDAPAMVIFKAEEKVIVMDLIKRSKELDSRYEAAYQLAGRLNTTRSPPCGKPELQSAALVSACQELAATAEAVRTARNGYCREPSPDNHAARVNDASPCAAAAKRYWSATSEARALYLQKQETAEGLYGKEMMPACSFWQRITFRELDRATLRARQECVTRILSPDVITKCTQVILKGL